MKALLTITVLVIVMASSCRKESSLKPSTPTIKKDSTALKPLAKAANKPTGATYDYQKAIMAKRTIATK